MMMTIMLLMAFLLQFFILDRSAWGLNENWHRDKIGPIGYKYVNCRQLCVVVHAAKDEAGRVADF